MFSTQSPQLHGLPASGPDVPSVLKPLSLGSQGFLHRARRLAGCGIPDSPLEHGSVLYLLG